MPGSVGPALLFFFPQRYRNGHRLLTRVKNTLRPRPVPVKNYRARFTRDFRSPSPPLRLPSVPAGSRKVAGYIKPDSNRNRYLDTLPRSSSYRRKYFFLFNFFESSKSLREFRFESHSGKEREGGNGKKRNESIRKILRRDRPIKIIKKISRRISTSRFNRRENFFVGSR